MASVADTSEILTIDRSKCSMFIYLFIWFSLLLLSAAVSLTSTVSLNQKISHSFDPHPARKLPLIKNYNYTFLIKYRIYHLNKTSWHDFHSAGSYHELREALGWALATWSFLDPDRHVGDIWPCFGWRALQADYAAHVLN